jgi:hypothetical protein
MVLMNAMHEVWNFQNWDITAGLARRFRVCLLQYILLRQVFTSSSEGGTRTVAHLQLVRVLVVVARWSKDVCNFYYTVAKGL